MRSAAACCCSALCRGVPQACHTFGWPAGSHESRSVTPEPHESLVEGSRVHHVHHVAGVGCDRVLGGRQAYTRRSVNLGERGAFLPASDWQDHPLLETLAAESTRLLGQLSSTSIGCSPNHERRRYEPGLDRHAREEPRPQAGRPALGVHCSSSSGRRCWKTSGRLRGRLYVYRGRLMPGIDRDRGRGQRECDPEVPPTLVFEDVLVVAH